jgi:hypothetical protein
VYATKIEIEPLAVVRGLNADFRNPIKMNAEDLPAPRKDKDLP